MCLRVLFFFLPLCLGAEELVWSSAANAGLSKIEFDKAISVYVEKTYPQRVERFKREQRTVNYAGLMWQDNAQAQELELKWNGAMQHCEDLDFAGYQDWRLPSLQELSKLPTGEFCGIQAGFNALENCSVMNFSRYWSSTLSKSNTMLVGYVAFDQGTWSEHSKITSLYVRCVREEIQ